MTTSLRMLGATLFLLGAVACSAGDDDSAARWAEASVTIDGKTYDLEEVRMNVEFGEDGYYNIDARPTTDPDEDCVPGLSGGMFLYGSLPQRAQRLEDLAGQRLLVEFSGDGDDANLCFPGMNGLLGAREAWVTIDSIDADRVRFSMSGSFELFDEEGATSELVASAAGTAQLAAY
jgi:hypothetical protein